MLDDIDDLAFGDATDLIELKTAFALEVFWRLGWTKECIRNHRDSGDRGSNHSHGNFQIGEYEKQQANSHG
jgi:hypothetical protein